MGSSCGQVVDLPELLCCNYIDDVLVDIPLELARELCNAGRPFQERLMSEGPLDELQHGGSVLDFRAKAPGSAEMRQGLVDEQQSADTSSPIRSAIPWMARLTLGLPRGVVRHPSLLDRMQDEIGRPCAVDVRS